MNRKNKMGFTLIELLAVIVILSVIIMITVPMVQDKINESKKNAFFDILSVFWISFIFFL